MNTIFGQRTGATGQRTLPVGRILRAFPGLMCLIGASALLASARAQPAALPPEQTRGTNAPANRWLIVVETSKRMKSRADGVQQSIPPLVFSGMNGQMWHGDTLGLWTFDEELHSGQFPLQDWTPGNCQNIALEVSDFLKAQKYENDSYPDKVLPYIQRLVKSSDYITVLLVTDGRKKIQGTPFDNKINAFFETWQKQQDKAHMPFITVLRAEHGQITNYSMTIPPYPLELPPLPPELAKRMEQPAAPPVAAQRVLPPLIVHGPKPSLTPAETATTNVASPVPATTNATQVLQSAATTVATGETPAPAPAPVKTNTTPAATPAAMPVQTSASNPPPQTSGEMAQSARPGSSTPDAGTAPPGAWSRLIWIAAAAGAVIVAFLFGWSMGRSSAPYRVSLVSRSSDQDQRK